MLPPARRHLLAPAALCTIAAAFASLARGDITVGPVLLVLGLLVLVPLAIVRS